MLSGSTALASNAVSMALQAGAAPSHCIGLLELGRGLIMGLAINCRSDVSELQIKHPDICDRFNRLRIQIDRPLGGQDIDNPTHEDNRRQRVQAIKEIDEILLSIRQLPDFADFQLAPRPQDLTALAAEGTIIIFNCTELRSDAIIVTGSIKSIPLPKMFYSEVEEKMSELPKLVRGQLKTTSARNQKMAKILRWLWDVAVEPVLKAIGYDVPRTDVPRVWWIGVGPLATAPFHAAGNHSRNSKANTISRVISSYIPTIKALIYATQKKLDLKNQDTRLLLVTMPPLPTNKPRTQGTPVTQPSTNREAAASLHPIFPPTFTAQAPTGKKQMKPLPNVAAEAREILDAVIGTRTTEMIRPTTSQVLENLPAHDVIHFACHGISDPKNPSSSYLLLAEDDGSEGGELTVGAISDLKMRNGQVAYLSACSTALNKSTELADESIHIASGFQLAGFSHVLGTLWPSDDTACRLVAGEFYRTLFNGKTEGHRAVSSAFHHSVLKLRETLWGQPIKWVPFIHTGA